MDIDHGERGGVTSASRWRGARIVLLATSLLSACSDEGAQEVSHGTDEPTPLPVVGFIHRTDTGLDFLHVPFTNREKKFLPETAGSGVALFDYDNDGDLDVYALQCRPLPTHPDAVPEDEIPTNQLFEMVAPWSFEDVTADAGVGDRGYGMGATAPDIDNDGFSDLFVTNVGANVLYRNGGKRSFELVAGADALAAPRMWSTAAGWADLDRDGDLDCYLANYAALQFEGFEPCSERVGGEVLISYCHPDSLTAAPDQLLRNDGGLTFTDVTAAAGIVEAPPGGKGLAVVPFDHDSDGWIDLFIANDCDENFCWRNLQGMRFEELALMLSLDRCDRGKTQACMGTDIGDVDGDGDFDIFCANFGKEWNALYIRDGDFYEDRIKRSGMAGKSYDKTGFGAEFFDYDNDADLDLMVVNGHIVDVIEQVDNSQTYRQAAQFFRNTGDGTFEETGSSLSPWFDVDRLGRGLAVGDLDDDGDLDVVVANNDGRLSLLENRCAEGRHWIGFDLTGSRSPRDAIGARVTVRCGDRSQVEEIRATSSYLSWADLRLHFGLGERTEDCEVTIRWPSGEEQLLSGLGVDQYHAVVEPN